MKKLWYSKKVKRNDGKCRYWYDKIEKGRKEEIREKIKKHGKGRWDEKRKDNRYTSTTHYTWGC